MDRLLRIFLPALALVLLSACTSMGTHNHVLRTDHDFGAVETVDVCLYLDDGITEETGRKLVYDAWHAEGHMYGIELNIVRVEEWPRPAFHMEAILAELRQKPLEAPCDRILALVGRNLGDMVWAFFGPEVLGAVNDETLTHGYTVAQRRTVNQLLMSPVDVTRHEIYHMLGCDIHYDMPHCYDQIARLKEWRRTYGGDFFPAWDLVNKRLIPTREAVNVRLAEVNNVSTVATARAR
jgi:hypothetical protein